MQRSELWLAKRLGKITGTRAHSLLQSARTRDSLLATLVHEMVTWEIKESFVTPAMQRGIDMEPLARAAYEEAHDVAVHSHDDFFERDGWPLCAASPDGLVGDDGAIEIKCLSQPNHIRVAMTETIDPKHVSQMLWVLFVTGRKWCDYVGYCGDIRSELQLYVKRFEISEEQISHFEKIVTAVDGQIANFLRDRGLIL